MSSFTLASWQINVYDLSLAETRIMETPCFNMQLAQCMDEGGCGF